MQNSNLASFEFDKWVKLAKHDPAGFEVARRQAIDEVIAEAPQHMRERLNRLQWRIDMERTRAKDPLVSCQRVFDMMWDSVYGDNGLLSALEQLTGASPIVPSKSTDNSKPSATILSFSDRAAAK